MIENAISRNSNMDFRVAGCEKIPFADDSMDIITVCAAYHHFPDTGAFAREAKRVLRPGGMIYVADVYIPSFLRVMLNPFIPLLFYKDGDVKMYSPKEIIGNFERIGFEVADKIVKSNVQLVSLTKRSI